MALALLFRPDIPHMTRAPREW